jgi:hypothetical protein
VSPLAVVLRGISSSAMLSSAIVVLFVSAVSQLLRRENDAVAARVQGPAITRSLGHDRSNGIPVQ